MHSTIFLGLLGIVLNICFMVFALAQTRAPSTFVLGVATFGALLLGFMLYWFSPAKCEERARGIADDLGVPLDEHLQEI